MKLSKGHCLWFGNIVVMKRSQSGQFMSITTSDRRLLERIVLRFVHPFLSDVTMKFIPSYSLTYGREMNSDPVV